MADTEGSANRFAEDGTEINNGVNYDDVGDISFPDPDPAAAFTTIRNKIEELVSSEDPVLSLGGDHSISYPVIDAFTGKYGNLNVLHLDAHGDLYENFDNNPFSHASPFARLMEKGKINSLTQVGIRTLTTHQKQQAEKFGVRIIEMKNFSPSFLNTLQSPLYISLDIDVLDPVFAPGISHHEPGGFSTRELIRIIQQVTAHVVGADIVEYNPIRDVHNVTAMLAYKLMKELMVKMIR
jgi:agmatinase